jgi:hypothetical protein
MKPLGIVIFGCLTKDKYREQIEDCYNTWVKDAIDNDCLVRFYVDKIPSDIDPSLKNLCIDLQQGDDYISATFKQWRGFEHMVNECDPCDFYYTCGTDTFLNVKNALKELEAFDKTEYLSIGGGYGEETVEGVSYKYFSGGGGVFLTRCALEKVLEGVPDFMAWWMSSGDRVVDCMHEGIQRKKSILGASDLQLGILCKQNDIKFISLGSLKLVGDGTHNRDGVDKQSLVSCHLMKHADFYDYHMVLHN